MPYSQYFATTYLEARQNFIASCAAEATFCRSWQHPLRGSVGEKLYLDLAWFGDRHASKVMVLLSGTHGIEGFCGSGIQIGSLATGLHLQATNDVAILMLHGLNPWGMSFYRRVNEDGVDINRNFLDFSQPLPKNPLYQDLADIIVPQQWTPKIQQETFQQIFAYLADSQVDQTKNLAQGQYSHWYAPFYGGEVPTWSNRIFTQIVEQYLQDKQAVGLLDYHTGLGKYGTGQLMTVEQNDSRQSDLGLRIWGDKVIIAGSPNSVAPYKPQGTLIAAIAALQKTLSQSTCIAAVYEFGTIAETEIFTALRADHWLHLHGDLNSKQAQMIKNNLLEAFYCDRSDWQESICNLAFAAQIKLLTGLKSIS